MSGIKVSVIIPVYNTEKYICECIDSIINQSLDEIEIICIDDDSTDRSYEILLEYAKKDPRVKAMKSEKGNQGPGALRNRGIKIAKGEYIAFVDSDDYIDKDMLKKLYNRAINKKLDIAMCTIKKFTDESMDEYLICVYDRYIPKRLDNKVFNWIDIEDVIFKIRYGPCNKIYNRDFLLKNEIEFSEGIFFEDMIFTYKALFLAKRMQLIREPLYFNRKMREGATTFTQGSRAFGTLEAMDQLEKLILENENLHHIEERFQAYKFDKLVFYLHRNDHEHIVPFYKKLKEYAQDPVLENNPYLKKGTREILYRIREKDIFEFLTEEYFNLTIKNAALRRMNKKLLKRNPFNRLKRVVVKGISKPEKIKKILLGSISWFLLSAIGRIFPRSKNKIAVMAPDNSAFADNAKYAYLWIQEETDFDVTYITYDREKNKQLKSNGINAIYYLSLSGILHLLRTSVAIGVATTVFRQEKGHLLSGAKLIQLWHGAGIKYIHLNNKKYKKKRTMYKKVTWLVNRKHPEFDLIYFPSETMKKERKNSFKYKQLKVNGFPRNDCLLGKTFNGKEEIYTDKEALNKIKELKSKGSKLVLYAPTYRKKNREIFGTFVPFDLDEINKLMKKNNAYFVIKLHPWINENLDLSNYERIIMYEKTKDIYPILSSFDILLTDYSSIFSDYSLLNRPIIYYFPDYNKAVNTKVISKKLADKMPGKKFIDFSKMLVSLDAYLNDSTNIKIPNDNIFHEQKKEYSGTELIKDIKKLIG